MNNKNRVLLVEDSTSNATVYKSYLMDNYSVDLAMTGHDALTMFSSKTYQSILLDVQLPDMSGLDVLRQVRSENANIPIVIITAHGSVDIALEAMREGASDFLSKPFDKARLSVTIANLIKEYELSQIVKTYEKSRGRSEFFSMVGSSLPMQSVYNIIESAASSKATVFITGESGTGKELCAEAIHKSSPRSSKGFVALNCAAIPHELLESEIFGHMKGAFTGASSSREGAAARAHEGTLFLDEIGEMPLSLQSKLLRFIQTGRFQPVGSSKEVEVDIRFVCATNRDPLEEVKAGRFREDLYYRLHVIPIDMPPLRNRNKDVLQIAESFIKQIASDENKNFTGLEEDVAEIFLKYDWPGNVRELGNVIRNVIVLNNGSKISSDMLPHPLNGNNKVRLTDNPPVNEPEPTNDRVSVESSPKEKDGDRIGFQLIDDIVPLWLAEKRYIEQVIEKCNGNVPKAAAFLDISASTIYRKRQQWEAKSA